MERLALVVGLVLAALCGPVEAAIWNCRFEAAYEVEAGKLQLKGDTPFGPNAGEGLIYDEATGVVRFIDAGPDRKVARALTFKVWQAGSSENSAVALFASAGPASNPLITLRIYTWHDGKEKSVVLADEAGRIGTGSCTLFSSR